MSFRISLSHPLYNFVAVAFVVIVLCSLTPAASAHNPADPTLSGSSESALQAPERGASLEQIGLNQSQKETLRNYLPSLADRVENVRNHSFTIPPQIEFLSVNESLGMYPNRYYELLSTQSSPTVAQISTERWWETVLETLLIRTESNLAPTALFQRAHLGPGVVYMPGDRRHIVVIEDALDELPTNASIANELGQLLQYQISPLSVGTLRTSPLDAQHATAAQLDGVGAYIERTYRQQYLNASEGARQSNLLGVAGQEPGVTALTHRGTLGELFVASRVSEYGWGAINNTTTNTFNFSREVINAGLSLESRLLGGPPAVCPDGKTLSRVNTSSSHPITFTDSSADDWQRLQHGSSLAPNANGERLGEASLFAIFWHHAKKYATGPLASSGGRGNGTLSECSVTATQQTRGLLNDRLIPYVAPEPDEIGSVWVTQWATETDAVEFARAYIDILNSHQATQIDPVTYNVSTDAITGVYRIIQYENHVTITQADSLPATDTLRGAYYFGSESPIVNSEIAANSQLIKQGETPNVSRSQNSTAPSNNSSSNQAIIALLVLFGLALLATWKVLKHF
jgi:hypothetical protein